MSNYLLLQLLTELPLPLTRAIIRKTLQFNRHCGSPAGFRGNPGDLAGLEAISLKSSTNMSIISASPTNIRHSMPFHRFRLSEQT